MTALLATCTKEKQWAVIQLSWAEVVRMWQRTEDYHHSTVTVFCCSDARTNGLTDMFKNSWTSVTDEKSVCTSTKWNCEQVHTLTLGNSVPIDNMVNKCRLIMVLPQSSTTDFNSIRLVWGGFENNSRNNRGIITWKSLNWYYDFRVTLSLSTKYRPKSMSLRANARVWNITFNNCFEKEVQISTSSKWEYAHIIPGFVRTIPWALSENMCDGQRMFLWHDAQQTEAGNSR
jgi:hypothetical protein